MRYIGLTRYVNFEPPRVNPNPNLFGVSRCSRPLSTAHSRNASLALGARVNPIYMSIYIYMRACVCVISS